MKVFRDNKQCNDIVNPVMMSWHDPVQYRDMNLNRAICDVSELHLMRIADSIVSWGGEAAVMDSLR